MITLFNQSSLLAVKNLFFSLIFLSGLAFAQIPDINSKIEGMIYGSVIGDAAGGPLEFSTDFQRSKICTSKKKLTPEGIAELASMFTFRQYTTKAHPFGAWTDSASAGSVTDDTRIKMILFRALNKYGNDLKDRELALQISLFKNDLPKEEFLALFDEWITDYQGAANWVLGNRSQGIPPDRIFGGVSTINGQTAFLPMAALNHKDPTWCYKRTFDIDFFETGYAKDFTASIIAGLACALQKGSDMNSFISGVKNTDPYNYKKAPYVERQVNYWMDLSDELVEKADGRIAVLFDLLDQNLEAKYYWESWVPLVVTLSCGKMAKYNPLATMQLILEYGHDTDSALQLAGAIFGALYGKEVWPKQMRDIVKLRVAGDYDQDIDGWVKVLKVNRVKS